MRIIFFGSDDFAAVHLEKLFDSKHEVVAVVTQPDKAKGRGMKVQALPVKELAVTKKADILQPENLKDKEFVEALKNFDADLFIVIAYGKFLPVNVLNIPKISAINVHSSLLPKYRGAAPINWAIVNGEIETGITIMKLNERMDSGDILAQTKFNIRPDEDAVLLRNKMKGVAPKFLLNTIELIEKDEVTPVKQKEKDVSFAPKLTKELGQIDWKKSAAAIRNQIRGLKPWPCAYTSYKGKMLKILETELVEVQGNPREPSEVVAIFKKGMIVATGEGGLLVYKVHLQDSREMDALSFCNGQRLEVGFRFG